MSYKSPHSSLSTSLPLPLESYNPAISLANCRRLIRVQTYVKAETLEQQMWLKVIKTIEAHECWLAEKHDAIPPNIRSDHKRELKRLKILLQQWRDEWQASWEQIASGGNIRQQAMEVFSDAILQLYAGIEVSAFHFILLPSTNIPLPQLPFNDAQLHGLLYFTLDYGVKRLRPYQIGHGVDYHESNHSADWVFSMQFYGDAMTTEAAAYLQSTRDNAVAPLNSPELSWIKMLATEKLKGCIKVITTDDDGPLISFQFSIPKTTAAQPSYTA